MPVDLNSISMDDVKAGIRLILPILHLIAARTKTTTDDALVAWLEGVVANSPTAVAMLSEPPLVA